MRRFHLPDLPATGAVWLEGEDGRHLARVLRARPGDEVRVFDGAGREAAARVAEVGRDRVLLELAGDVTAPEPLRPVTLVAAIPRGKRMEVLVEKCVEAGVSRIVPLAAARSVRQEAGDRDLRRWRRAAVEACKQCGRARVPEVSPPVALHDALAGLGDTTRLVAEPGAARTLLQAAAALPAGRPVALIVGPEGGFTRDEAEEVDAAGAEPVGLGGLILRIETAAVVGVHALAWSGGPSSSARALRGPPPA